jgi:hypothetical protein
MLLQFTFAKETKGAVQYKEKVSNGTPESEYVIGTLYLRKDALVRAGRTSWPQSFEVEVKI